MIGFGELRRRSVEWQMDLAAVERIYATDWLVKGIFDSSPTDVLALRGGPALRHAYSADYPFADPPEFWSALETETALEDLLARAVQGATEASGLSFSLTSVTRGAAKVEFGGPLGRRSAAQPHITLSFLPERPRLAPDHRPLIHPFGDECTATVAAVTLDELAAERVATLAAQPRARDVYDLWFAVTQIRQSIDWTRMRVLAEELARERKSPLPQRAALFKPAHRAVLERAWEGALRHSRGHPSFERVEQDLYHILEPILA